jgi:four helix bundle protein
MAESDLSDRTKTFAIRIIRQVAALPSGRVGDVLGRQVLKSGTSIGANWREAKRASSKKQFISTKEICIREGDETLYWLDRLTVSELVKPSRLVPIRNECNELVAILTPIVKNSKSGGRSQRGEA